MPAATPSVMVDNGRIRVTRWHFEPGASTGMHTHEFDYVVVPITGGNFNVISQDQSVTAMVQNPGESYSRSVGVTHDVTNVGHSVAVFVEVELLP